jgi:subtilisin family serine protease
VRIEPDGRAADGFRAVLGDHADLYGHGTACASLIRQAAPDAELFSVQVLGSQLRGAAAALVTGLRWAIDNGMDVVNLSLGTQVESWAGTLHALADEAYFQRVMLVCAASNRPRAAFPGVFASVFSVAAHDRHDPFDFDYNPNPPVEIAAPGVAVRAAWLDGATVTLTGNSYAAAHVSGIVARILSKHPGLTPFQMKTVLAAVATNAESRPAEPTEGSR